VWLHNIPGIKFRTKNDVFMVMNLKTLILIIKLNSLTITII
jgi:hypothetical protein